MPRLSTLPRSNAIYDASIASSCLFDLLTPAVSNLRSAATRNFYETTRGRTSSLSDSSTGFDTVFYTALTRASHCKQHKDAGTVSQVIDTSLISKNKQGLGHKTQTAKYHGRSHRLDRCSDPLLRPAHQTKPHRTLRETGHPTQVAQIPLPSQHDGRFTNGKVRHSSNFYGQSEVYDIVERQKCDSSASESLFNAQPPRETNRTFRSGQRRRLGSQPNATGPNSTIPGKARNTVDQSRTASSKPINAQNLDPHSIAAWSNIQYYVMFNAGIIAQKPTLSPLPSLARTYHTRARDKESEQRQFAEGSYLPSDFFNDVSVLKDLPKSNKRKKHQAQSSNATPSMKLEVTYSAKQSSLGKASIDIDTKSTRNVVEHMKLLSSVRELEAKLEKAKKDLAKSMIPTGANKQELPQTNILSSQIPIVLTKEDYMNLVDLYYYSHNSRFSPESTDESPTPLILNDYSFTLSSDFSSGAKQTESVNEDESYESPLKKIDEMLRQRQLREVAVMQVFVDLLLDDGSSNRALYEAYKQLPDPGVAYLPKGIIRLYLQRMSTPWTLSEKSMLRYLALIDDMQNAKIPITAAEWSSAVYLAGRAFSNVTDQEVNNSFSIWNVMEHEAGVRGSHVTFNILFDIAVRSGRFALGETILKEMHSRNLRLNRLGRVSLMYYHGLRKDGDGVRKAYRDFVEAGEIVDTLVMNCVIASLLNAQEPQAAEQVYARMKNIQVQLQKGFHRDGGEVLFKQYPDPGGNTIDFEMASNHLGRILEKAPRLKGILPDHHKDLQARMPLTPDHLTFRSMIAYHATTSGDLDRLTVLLQEMTDDFQLPLQTITFQLLFKGFAFHGPVGGPRSTWSIHRLELCWIACRAAIKASEKAKPPTIDSSAAQNVAISDTAEEDDLPPSLPTLPSIIQINAMPQHAPSPDANPQLSRPQPRRLSDWSEFVLDLAAFPRERLKRLERFHATMFDAEDKIEPHEKPGVHTYQSPYFQSTAYTAPEPQLDKEEGEYELPNPSESGLLQRIGTRDGSDGNVDGPDSASPSQEAEPPAGTPHQVTPTKAMVCWLLRAYARNTKSRYKVEEIWNSVRKLYKPKDTTERESVVRVLRRCLRDCDREGSG